VAGKRAVTLRDEHNGEDHRHLSASLDSNGNLVIEGHDLGPGTAMISSDGEYEWTTTVAAGDIGRLLELLGAARDANILDVLVASYTGRGSYELETIIRESDIEVERWSWSG
jgi:hypothetical protein